MNRSQLERRTVSVTVETFKRMLQAKEIRSATLNDVEGTTHSRALYRHPNTGQWFVAVGKVRKVI